MGQIPCGVGRHVAILWNVRPALDQCRLSCQRLAERSLCTLVALSFAEQNAQSVPALCQVALVFGQVRMLARQPFLNGDSPPQTSFGSLVLVRAPQKARQSEIIEGLVAAV